MKESKITRLVLSRKKSEAVIVKGPCVVTVVSLTGNRAKLMFKAETSVGIVRKEIAA